MPAPYYTADELLARQSALPFQHLAWHGPTPTSKQRQPHWKRTGHKKTRARWLRMGRR